VSERAAIALGANLGDRAATLSEAIRRIGALGRVVAVSSLYETEPVGYLDQPRFLNAALLLDTELEPEALLDGLQAIEQNLGRVRTFRNAPRTLDLDLLFYGDRVIETARLTVPHPRLQERAFVLVPLGEIAPDFVHPGIGTTVRALLDQLPDRSGIVPSTEQIRIPEDC